MKDTPKITKIQSYKNWFTKEPLGESKIKSNLKHLWHIIKYTFGCTKIFLCKTSEPEQIENNNYKYNMEVIAVKYRFLFIIYKTITYEKTNY